MLNDRLDSIMHEKFAEKLYDPMEALSVEDQVVIDKYENSIEKVGDRYKIKLSFKADHVELPNNYHSMLIALLSRNRFFFLNAKLKK